MKPQPEVLAALEQTGLPWELTNGGKHTHIRVGGRLAGILPRGSGTVDRRVIKNCVAQIKRKASEVLGHD